ncbi:hypothetical protein [uncultured Sphingomonas sp.]|uniref:hypothetical protein n=1 Tax=uncultured Sphingomonas sp. TaxID=158754 RepID=UPI0035CCA9C6
MDENELKPMTDGDATPPADTQFVPAAPLKEAGAEFEPEDGPATPTATVLPASTAEAKQQVKDGAARLSSQASEKALTFADQGKERAVGAIEQLSQMLTDAASQVDEKLGEQYGHYARTAAGTAQGYADRLRDKKVDDLLDDARALVRKSPGVAIGVAAALGFVVSRLASAGLDQRDA